MNGKKPLNILFIGNSHTYFNDMPLMVRRRAEDAGYACRTVMIAHGGWFLAQHATEPDVRFNILYGGFDYVVLQEHAHPFGPEEKFHDAAAVLNGMIREAGSIPVIYETWARKSEPEVQPYMNEVHERIASGIGALIAPVGQNWWEHLKGCPDVEMYAEDGAHASVAGSEFAAGSIWETIQTDLKEKKYGDQTHAALMSAVAENDAGQQAMMETQPEPEQEQPVAGQTTIRVLIKSSGGKVNIRTGNGTSYSRITAVAPGTTLEYVASAFNGWQAVKIGSQVGWVSGEYSEITTE